ncbi:cellulose synthase subunit BcsC [Posidoniimonas corsicana]|uniref:Cellulose synthase subunit BcsC n=1 Tax=Posidoniimonas corsicana TaxID=1938618 RepID=A0A5C5VBT2_9BACT|nr:tetratricopeptide repeat protein [Posidoniimonas corsicana]TWT36018.1 cellulose synthase subunit BcsC [Posidoniimonas corsicana]
MASRPSFNTLLCAIAVAPLLASAADERPLTEGEQDRAQAAASYALGKTLYAQSDLAGALRAYQRSWRWDPTQTQLLDEVIPLAVSLGHGDEAIRYAVIQSQAGGVAPEMLRRLALFAAESQQWRQAAILYERWLDRAPERDASFEKAMIRIELGRLYQQLGQYEDASRSLAIVQQELLDSPESDAARRLTSALGGSLAQVYETFGQCHLEAGKLGLAGQAFAQIADGIDAEPGVQFWLAKLALAKSQPLEAYSQLREYFQQPGDPYGADPYSLLRATLTQLNDRGRWPVELQRIREERPDSLYALRADAVQRSDSGCPDDAASLLRRLVDAAVGSEAPIDEETFNESANWLIKYYTEADDANRILPLIEQLGQVDPSLADHADALKSAMRSDAFASQIATRLQVLLNAEPAAAERLLPAARLAAISGRHELAVELFRKGIGAVDQNAGPLTLDFAIGLILADEGSLAAGLIRDGLNNGSLEQDDPAAWYYLSAALPWQSNPDDAVNAARKAAELAPDSPDFAAQIARVLQAAGREEQAVEQYADLLGKFDDEVDDSARQPLREARLSYSYLLLKLGKTDAAIEQLQLVLDEFPGDPGASNDLAYLWADRGLHPERSLRMAQSAVDAEPENPAYLDSYGWAQFRLGRHDEATTTLRRAVALTATPDAEILDHLGQTLAASGEADAARREWRRAIQALAEQPERKELREAILGRIDSLQPERQQPAPSDAE